MVSYSDGIRAFDSEDGSLLTLIENHIIGKKTMDINSIIRHSSASLKGWRESELPNFKKETRTKIDEVKEKKLFGNDGLLAKTKIDISILGNTNVGEEGHRILGMTVDGKEVRDFSLGDMWNQEKKSVVVGETLPEEDFDWKEGEPAGGKKPSVNTTSLGEDFGSRTFSGKDAGETLGRKIKATKKIAEKGQFTIETEKDAGQKTYKDDDKGKVSGTRAFYLTAQTKIVYGEDFSDEKNKALARDFANVSYTQNPKSTRAELYGEIIGAKRHGMPQIPKWNPAKIEGPIEHHTIPILGVDFDMKGGKVVQPILSTSGPENTVINLNMEDIINEDTKKYYSLTIKQQREMRKEGKFENLDIDSINSDKVKEKIEKEIKDIAESNYVIKIMESLHSNPYEVISFELVINIDNVKIATRIQIGKETNEKKYSEIPIEYSAKLYMFRHGTYSPLHYKKVGEKDKRKQYKYQPTLDTALRHMRQRVQKLENAVGD